MGDAAKFPKPPRNRGQFRGQGGWEPPPKGPRWPKLRAWLRAIVRVILPIVVLLALAILWWGIDKARAAETFTCNAATVIDGDTFKCDGQRIRLQGIDAPELPRHYRKGRDCTPGDPYASTESLTGLLSAGNVERHKIDTDVYGRIVARCKAAGVDLSCKQIESGHAVRRYGPISC